MSDDNDGCHPRCGEFELRVVHVEAGLRSRSRQKSEEIHLEITNHAYDFLLAPKDLEMAHLDEEGLSKRLHLIGTAVIDLIVNYQEV